jgi:hypothetical protein
MSPKKGDRKGWGNMDFFLSGYYIQYSTMLDCNLLGELFWTQRFEIRIKVSQLILVPVYKEWCLITFWRCAYQMRRKNCPQKGTVPLMNAFYIYIWHPFPQYFSIYKKLLDLLCTASVFVQYHPVLEFTNIRGGTKSTEFDWSSRLFAIGFWSIDTLFLTYF